MKVIKVLVSLLLLLACCTVEERVGEERLLLFAQMDAALTRATVDNAWTGGEQVQVSIDGNQPEAFTAAAGGALTPNSPLYWQSAAQTISARAWYPAAWTMQTDQSDLANYQAADFIFAPTVSDISLANVASKPLTFYHKTAKVTAFLTAGTDVSSVAGATVSFYGYTSGSANTGDGTLSGSTNGWIQSRNSSGSHTALLIPQTLTSVAFIKVTLGGFDYLYKPATLTLEAGKAYTFGITVDKTGLTLTSSSSLSWDEGTTEGLTAAPAHTLALEGIAPGTEITVKYADNTEQTSIAGADLPYSSGGDKIIRSIQLNNGDEILIGRKEGDFSLKFDAAGNLIFREADEEDNIPIGAYAEFQLINTVTDGLSGHYKQEADLDLMNEEWMPIGNGSNSFVGAFDGGGHKLANLKIDNAETNNAGLFGSIKSGSTVSNITIVSGSVSGGAIVGSVCGYNEYSTITACYNTAPVSGSRFVGGVCGYNYGTLIACYNTGSVSGGDYVGGVCGNNFGNITACYNTASVSGGSYVGGVCGQKSNAFIACFWEDIQSDNASNGIGTGLGDLNDGAAKFGNGAWPSESTHDAWKLYENGGYWKDLGGWNGGNPVYPRLWFEP